MSDQELLDAMRAAVVVAKVNGVFQGGRVNTPSYSVAFNGTGYLVTCSKFLTVPFNTVMVCEGASLQTHFIPASEVM